jgi:Tol biopolymer transport system component
MWSPDGTMVAFFTQPPESTPAGAQGPTYLQIRVVPAAGGEVKTIAGRSVRAGLRLPGRWTWFPDGKELTAVSEDEGIIANFPIAGGDRRRVVPLKDLGIAQVSWLRWSPDGRFLAFQGGAGRMDMKLYVYQPDDAKLQRLADENVAPFYWSPDSRWISFFSTQPVKTRPEGVLWEMDVEEALAQLAK